MQDKLLERLIKTISRFNQAKIAVIGDFIADIYIYSLASRVSREAPVLILKYEKETLTLGGGANALNNTRSLGAKVFAIGVLGKDKEGQSLKSKMKELGIDTSFIVEDNITTPTKIRILAGSHHTVKQQVLRLDREPEEPLNESIQYRIVENIEKVKDKVDAFIISDYGYYTASGMVRDYIVKELKGKIVVVDSRYNLLEFKGVTAATPNEPETAQVLGMKEITDQNIEYAGRKLLEITSNTAILITRGKKGMALFEGDSVRYIDIYGTDEVADVTGAGDTVIATFTTALSCGATFFEAAKLANYAGGIVVTKAGTATVSRDELLEAVKDDLQK